MRTQIYQAKNFIYYFLEHWQQRAEGNCSDSQPGVPYFGKYGDHQRRYQSPQEEDGFILTCEIFKQRQAGEPCPSGVDRQ